MSAHARCRYIRPVTHHGKVPLALPPRAAVSRRLSYVFRIQYIVCNRIPIFAEYVYETVTYHISKLPSGTRRSRVAVVSIESDVQASQD